MHGFLSHSSTVHRTKGRRGMILSLKARLRWFCSERESCGQLE